MLAPLYAVLDVDSVTGRGWLPADVCRVWLSAGVRLIQLRAKSLASSALLDLADELAALCRDAGATFIINDRADIAAMSGAAGVHVGQQDLAPADVRRVVGPSAIVGLSTHDRAQIVAGTREPVSYLAVGPVFATETKRTGYDSLGLAAVSEAAAASRAAGRPLVAIGGLTLDRAGAVLDAGANALAVISDLLPSTWSEVEGRARAWLRASRAHL